MPGNNFSFQHRGHDVSNQPRLSNGQFTFSDSVTATNVASQGQQALEAVMPVHRNAPLEQRMYPSSIADIVKKHAHGDHSTLQPYSEDPEANVPYYRMGVRPLESRALSRRYGERVPGTDLHVEHMHFVGSDGSNFGLTFGGTFSESMQDLTNYQVEAPKYRKEYIDRAKIEVDRKWEERKILERFSQDYNPFTYNILTHNCQQYFAEVLQQAQEYDTPAKPLVLY